MSDRWSRVASLSGLAYLALLVASTAAAPAQPKARTTGAHVVAFFTAHRSQERAASIIGVLAVAAFICFAGALFAHVRTAGAGIAPAAVALLGAGLLGTGLTVGASLTYALSDAPTHLSPAAAQAMNAIGYDMVLPMIGGLLLFGAGMGIAVVRGGWLPAWAGWTLVALGVVAASPLFPASYFGIALWSAVVGVRLAMRGARVVRRVAAPAES
jgi:hypothetical protein